MRPLDRLACVEHKDLQRIMEGKDVHMWKGRWK